MHIFLCLCLVRVTYRDMKNNNGFAKIHTMNTQVPDNDLPVLPDIEKGKYRHYKGNFYEVIDICLHSETLEPHVLYSPLYHSVSKLWVRPYAMFTGTVEIEGVTLPRFEKVTE